jgi:ABC-type uncharacterized transport system substrate-binding protein
VSAPDASGRLGKPFPSELLRSGEIEGQNLHIASFSAEGQVGCYAGLARQAVAAKPDVMVVFGTDVVPGVLSASRVYAVELGVAKSLSHPGCNLTGVSVYSAETNGKLLQMLTETLPSAARIGAVSRRRLAQEVYRASLRDYTTKNGALAHRAGIARRHAAGDRGRLCRTGAARCGCASALSGGALWHKLR